jgi:hypothetical protein
MEERRREMKIAPNLIATLGHKRVKGKPILVLGRLRNGCLIGIPFAHYHKCAMVCMRQAMERPATKVLRQRRFYSANDNFKETSDVANQKHVRIAHIGTDDSGADNGRWRGYSPRQ